MEWVETTGRTVEEAKEAALDQLGVDDADAEFVIVSQPKAGLFGRVRGEARVRARVVPTAPRPKRGRSRRSGPEQRKSSSGARQRAGGGARGTSDDGDEGQSGQAVALADADPGVGDMDADSGSRSANGAARSETGAGGSAPRRRSRGGRGRGGSRGPGGAASGTDTTANGSETGAGAEEDRVGVATASTRSSSGRPQASRESRPRAADGAKEEPVGEVLSLEEQGESAREFIAGLVRELGLEADISVKVVDEDTAEVSVDGQELGILVGQGGATLAALQELARTVVQKQTGGHSDRILVDVAGYRARRADALQRFTRTIAEEILASATERALEPMSASDRKVVHDTVNEIDGVVTRSEGEDPRRYIVISPASSTEGPPDA